jgi:hypothetical protein
VKCSSETSVVFKQTTALHSRREGISHSFKFKTYEQSQRRLIDPLVEIQQALLPVQVKFWLLLLILAWGGGVSIALRNSDNPVPTVCP